MPESTKKIGDRGEQQALLFLKKEGYTILETNWRKNHLELDIIFMDNDTIVFVEVKTRTNKNLLAPQEVFSQKKQKNIIRAASLYLSEYTLWEKPSRFDLLCIYKNNSSEKIEHWKNVIITRNSMDSRYTSR